MSTTIVSNIAVFSDATGHGNQSHLVYAPVQQRWWLFYIDTKTATAVKTMVSSSNDLTTATWSAGSASAAFPSGRALSTNDQRNLGVALVPNAVNANDAAHVSVGIGPSASATGYVEAVRVKFTGASSVTWETWAETPSANPVAWRAVKGNAVGISSGGFVHDGALTLDNNQDLNARKSTNADTGSAWTSGAATAVVIDSSTVDANNAYALAPLASDVMLAVGENGGAVDPNMTDLLWVKSGATGTWSTGAAGATVFGSAVTQDSNDWVLCPVDATHVYAFRFVSPTSVGSRLFNGTSWSNPTNGVPTPAAMKAGAGMFAATDGTDLYLFVLATSSNNPLNYVKGTAANGTVTWGSWTTLEAAGSTARNYVSGCPAVGNSQVGVIYTAVNGSNFDIVLSALSLAGTTSAALLGVAAPRFLATIAPPVVGGWL